MHILVTGANGLVGRNTVRYILGLAEQHTVVATDIVPRTKESVDLPSGSAFVQADLTLIKDVDALFDASDKPIDAVIHMGAIPSPGNIDYRIIHHTNTTASYNVIYTAASRGIRRIVQASSVNATGLSYSDNKRRAQRFEELEFGMPLTEKNTPYLPEDAYSTYRRSSFNIATKD
jgi:nucleoside-diphosphate-sugar epimerase